MKRIILFYFFSDVQRDIEEVERYSQQEATKRLIEALHDSNDDRWLDVFKQALAKERNVSSFIEFVK